jgi:hypothetical protein
MIYLQTEISNLMVQKLSNSNTELSSDHLYSIVIAPEFLSVLQNELQNCTNFQKANQFGVLKV